MALITYLKNPTVIKNKQDLAQASLAIYLDAIKNKGLEPDNYFEQMEDEQQNNNTNNPGPI